MPFLEIEEKIIMYQYDVENIFKQNTCYVCGVSRK